MPVRRNAFLAACLTIALAGADNPSDEATKTAVKVTNAGAALFDARDAKGLALTYAPDARLEIISKDKETGELKTETKVGRNEIEAYYQQLFKSDDTIHARNTVEHARLIDADLLTISGHFEPNSENADPMKLPFIQVRARNGGDWQIVSLQVYVILK